MKTLFRKFFLIIITYSVTSVSIAAQEKTPEQVLTEATELLKEGTVERIPDMLNKMIAHGFNKKQKKQAYILLINAYLFDDLQKQATESLIRLLEEYPEYKPTLDDTKELQYIYNLHKPYPVFSMGPLGGLNVVSPGITKSYNVDGITTSKSTISGSGIQFGLQLNLRATNFMDIRLDALYSAFSYGFEQEINNTVSYTENISALTLPLWINPYLSLGDHKLYVKLGAAMNMVLSSNADVVSTTSRTNLNTDKLNNFMQVGGGAGFSLKVPAGYLSLDFSYLKGLGTMVSDSKRATIEPFDYMDDDYNVNTMMFSVSYVYIFYKLKR